ncbi:ABC transporter permease [Vagococcus fluvialis]|jgi:peptide/nickel transport system permease protein|uniref:ABC transporter permease n=1 Tax=Vagococcus fluvialis TaxID=2738 RepID=A0A7X6I1V6_9ENTE|nr:ABC transporter permease [Vagococcus fluvialis]MBO0486425.1 ABC transporter permease [Vagococcus fluvialis]NKC59268.1 ABC transporter permease [Vagococcus fluvialis]NKC66505.1 ABC transporter permease [Vagococcus fluvialis]NKD50336.1 ABC transporter permease [Vagococcus fluvialis]
MSKDKKQETISAPPTGFKMIVREFKKDKLALFSLGLLTILLLTIFIGAMFLDTNAVMKVSIFDKYGEPGVNGFILGADEGGRDVFGQLIIGARNSVVIGFAITIITSIIGVGLGIVAGYYGGIVDTVIMRIVDFIMVLPMIMIVIVFVTIIPKYNMMSFVWIMSAFYWVAKARLFRGKTLSESRRDYISASKTLGTSDFKIMFGELMPNLSSLIITNLTINFAANIGIETTLSYLGFGLPPGTPSLGTLIGYASNGVVLSEKTWIWAPASILILVMMLSINYVGQAFKRSADARQRLG